MSNLRTLGRKWLKSLQEIGRQGGRTGEIVLSEQETKELADKLRPRTVNSPNFDNEMAAALTVVTVNLAYYYYEGAGGVAFLQHLIPDGHAINTDKVGPRIEKLMLDCGLISKCGYKSWRYVGLFLRQAIVTKYYLPKLKYYLERFNNLIGIEKFETLSFEVYLHQLEGMLDQQQYKTGIFLDTLKSPDGFYLIKTVAYFLDKTRSNRMNREELKATPGFRDGFWDVVLPVIDQAAPHFAHFYPMPFFGYSDETNRVGFFFDAIGVDNRAFKIRLNGSSRTIDKTFYPITEENHLGSPIEVWIQGANYPIHTWTPEYSEELLFQALFSINDGKIISSRKYSRRHLEHGAYRLLTSGDMDDETASQLGIDNLNPFEILDIESDNSYSVWTIDLKPGIDLAPLGKCAESDKAAGLEWIESGKHRLPGANFGSAIFRGKLPAVKIRRADQLKHRHRIIVEFSDGNRKEVEWDQLEHLGVDAVLKLSSKPWKSGVVKLVPTGYSSIQPLCSSLRFLLAPADLKIRWPYELLSFNDKPTVEIESEDDLGIEWAKKPFNEHREGHVASYEFSPDAEMLSGHSVRFSELKLLLHLNHAEAYPLDPPHLSTREILWSSDLDEDFSFMIRGHRDGRLTLGLMTDDAVYPVWESLNEQTRKSKISSRDLKDGLSIKDFAVGRFCVKYKDEWKQTKCLFLNENGIKEALLKHDAGFLDPFPDELKGIFVAASEAIKHQDQKFKFEDEWKIPDSLKKFLKFIELGKKVFDASTAVDMEHYGKHATCYFEWIKWYFRFKDTNEINFTEILNSQPIGLALPPIDRWRKKIESLIQHFKQISDLPALFESWRVDIDDPFSGVLHSKIGKMQLGKQLSLAAYSYRKSDFRQTIAKVYQIKQQHPSMPIRTMACILEKLSMSHLGMIVSHPLPESLHNADPWKSLLLQAKYFFNYLHKPGNNTLEGANFQIFKSFLFAIGEENYYDMLSIS